MNPDALPLRDIHLPAPVSWWPPAPGWWIVVALSVVLCAGAVWLYRWRSARRNSPLVIARDELEHVRAEWSGHRDVQRLARDVSVWLRRVCITLYPRRDVASLTGDSWWRFLDEVAGTRVFGDDAGRTLAEAPYKASADIDSDGLLRLCETWLTAIPQNRSGGRHD
jgi:hypothetical protein